MRTVSMLTTLLLIVVGTAQCASAALRVCNDAPFLLNVAVGFPEAGTWKSRGWYQTNPGHCTNVIGGNLTNRYYYVHAVDRTGKNTWGDYAILCTRSDAFTIEGQNCVGRGAISAQFAQVDTNGVTDYQFNLTCSFCTSGSGYRYTMSLPRLTHAMSVAGRSVRASASGKLDVDFSGSELKASAVLYTDLIDLQREAGDIIRAQVNHNDDCDYILNVHTVSLTPDGSSLLVYGAAHYEDWECLEYETWFGDVDLGKHRLFEQNGDISVRLTPQTDGNNVWISVNVTGIGADGLIGTLLDSDWFGDYIEDLVLQSIPSVVHVGNIRSSLPAALQSFPLRLNDVAFYDRGSGTLGLRVSASVTVSAQHAEAVWAQLK